MSEELLSEIVAAERDIRLRVRAVEEETAARLAGVREEAAEAFRREADRLDDELARALEEAEREARDEARGVVAEARAYADRLRGLDAGLLEEVVVRHLRSLRQE